MTGFGRVNEHGGGPSGSQRGCNFATDVPTLSHSHHHNTAAHTQYHLDGFSECTAKVFLQTKYRCGLDVQSFPGESNSLLSLKGGEPLGLRCHVFILSADAALASMWA